MEGIPLGHKDLDQFLELGLTLGAITLFRVQGVCYFLDFLDLFSEHLLLRFHRVQAPVDATGQAVDLLVWEPPLFSSRVFAGSSPEPHPKPPPSANRADEAAHPDRR